jgi:ubiquinone biosynthesis protein
MERLRREIRNAHRRSFYGAVGGALIISAALLMGLDGLHPTMVGGVPLMTWVLGGLGTLLLVVVWPTNS